MRLAISTALALSAAATAAEARPRYESSIVRTDYGVPHITANSWGGIGYGVAYAYAQDNFCLIAEEFVTVNGERSLHFGPKATATLGFQPVDNLTSDVFFRGSIDLPALRAGAAAQSREARALVAGYVAGYNRFLRDAGSAGLPEACRGKAWVRPITTDDMLRLTEKQMLLAGSLALAPAIANAAPPAKAVAAAQFELPRGGELGLGSNGWAFGAEATANGRGMVIGNPHFPWFGPSRFWQMHVTLPGKFDVMGVGLAGTMIPSLGFNRDVAWTHTVTAARHFTLYQLKLDPADSTSYLVDGKPEKMAVRTVSVPMADGGAVERTLYSTRFGDVLAAPQSGLAWDATSAFAVRDANARNQRSADAWLGIGRAKSVADVRRAVSETLGIPWVNTIAADRHGNALHADVTAVPNVSRAFAADCATPFSAMIAARAVLLDGSRAACAWPTAAGTAEPGLMPASDQAVQQRRDYVTNSNDSYWLSNPRAPHSPLAPILGEHGKPVSLRTRFNFMETDAAIAAGRMDHARAKALVYGNRGLAAQMVVDPVLGLCPGTPAARRGCDVLRAWDRRYGVDSRGTYLFSKFWDKVRGFEGLWATPFDPADPVGTPRDLAVGGESGSRLMTALVAAMADLEKEGIALDAPWGEVQVARRGEERIAVHGGSGLAGVLNMQETRPIPGGVEPVHGSSYIQIVGFDKKGPVADAILTYSQSTDPASPHYGDQTRLHSRQGWQRLPFTRAEVAAAAKGPVLRISE